MICLFTSPSEQVRRREHAHNELIAIIREYGLFCRLQGFCLGILLTNVIYGLVALWR